MEPLPQQPAREPPAGFDLERALRKSWEERTGRPLSDAEWEAEKGIGGDIRLIKILNSTEIPAERHGATFSPSPLGWSDWVIQSNLFFWVLFLFGVLIGGSIGWLVSSDLGAGAAIGALVFPAGFYILAVFFASKHTKMVGGSVCLGLAALGGLCALVFVFVPSLVWWHVLTTLAISGALAATGGSFIALSIKSCSLCGSVRTRVETMSRMSQGYWFNETWRECRSCGHKQHPNE